MDLQDLMVKLGGEEIDGILLEGGGTLNQGALDNQEIQYFGRDILLEYDVVANRPES